MPHPAKNRSRPPNSEGYCIRESIWSGIRCAGPRAAVDGPIGRVAFGDVAGPGMVDEPFGQRQRQKQVALGDGDEAVAQTVEPELTDHRLIPSLRCGVFRRRVSTQQFVDPSTQLVGDLLRERPCGDTGAARQQPRYRISDSIPVAATSVFTAEAEGASAIMRKPLFAAGVRARCGRRVGGSAMASPPRVRGRSSSTPRYRRQFSARGRVIARWSSRRRSLP